MSVELKMDKLNVRNYSTWSTVMRSLLMSRGLWKYCQKDHHFSAEDAAKDEGGITELDMMKHEEAKHLMYASMEPAQIVSTGSCTSAYSLWRKIMVNHEGTEKDHRNLALSDFLGLKYHKDESIVQYCGRYELALGRLQASTYSVDESTKIWVFKNSLPKELKSAVNMWAMANADGTITELITQMKIQYHMDRGEGHEDTVALYSDENRRTHETSSRSSNQRTKTITTNQLAVTARSPGTSGKSAESSSRTTKGRRNSLPKGTQITSSLITQALLLPTSSLTLLQSQQMATHGSLTPVQPAI